MTTIFDYTQNEVDDLLRELNIMTPDEIANKFRREGIKGVAFDANCCPLANYISKKTGWFCWIDCKEYELWDIDQNVLAYGHTPDSVSRFVKRFDAGRYLFLDDNRI